jgi:hypothetical protein
MAADEARAARDQQNFCHILRIPDARPALLAQKLLLEEVGEQSLPS